uniref:CFA20 domain-containing protein n=2 Tax=Takifugu rubripes TaxID=31033 RepID=A0A674N7K3_TAKRU
MMKKTGEEFGCKITVTDDKIIRRQIILTTFTRKMKAKIYSGFVPIRLSSSFEHVNINLAKVTHVLFGTRYVETVKIKIHANCRIRSVYFSDRLYTHKELPNDYKVEENSTAPRVNTVVADVSMVPEGSRVQGYTKGQSKQRIGSALQTTAAGHDYVHGFHTILYSMEGSPLKFWKQEVKHGNVECITDEELKTLAIEVQGKDIQTTSISCPSDPEDSLGIRLPFFNLLIKKTGEDWCFEITVTDDKNVRWQIIQTTFRKDTKAMAHVACVPLRLSTSWERISIDLAKVTHALFGTKYMETSKIKIYANCRIRRVFFTDRLYSDQELPGDFKVNIIERKTAPSTNTRMAEKSSLVPAESRLESKQRPGAGLQTTTEKSNQGFHTILNSVEKAPLKLWKEEVENGDVKCIKDEIITSSAIEVQGSDMQSTSITCPPDPEESLGIRLPCLNLLVKKTGEDWGFELTLIDDKNVHQRIYLGSHSREGTPVPLSFRWPLKLSNYWQYFCLDLADVTNRVFKTNYVEMAKIKIYANCRIRRVYFTDRLYSYHELPSDYKVKISIQG